MSDIIDAKRKMKEAQDTFNNLPEAEIHSEIVGILNEKTMRDGLYELSLFLPSLPPGNLRNLVQGFVAAGQQIIPQTITQIKLEKAGTTAPSVQ